MTIKKQKTEDDPVSEIRKIRDMYIRKFGPNISAISKAMQDAVAKLGLKTTSSATKKRKKTA